MVIKSTFRYIILRVSAGRRLCASLMSLHGREGGQQLASPQKKGLLPYLRNIPSTTHARVLGIQASQPPPRSSILLDVSSTYTLRASTCRSNDLKQSDTASTCESAQVCWCMHDQACSLGRVIEESGVKEAGRISILQRNAGTPSRLSRQILVSKAIDSFTKQPVHSMP